MNKIEAAEFLSKYEVVESPDKLMYETLLKVAKDNEISGDILGAEELRTKAKKYLHSRISYEVPSDPDSEEFEKFWEALDAD